MKGKIICINAAIHKVMLENNTIIDTKVRGKIRNEHIEPVVGDNVIVDIKNNTIEKIGKINEFKELKVPELINEVKNYKILRIQESVYKHDFILFFNLLYACNYPIKEFHQYLQVVPI